MKYRVQAILIDTTGMVAIEVIANSITTTDYQAALDHLMKKHKSSHSYLYIVMELESQNIIYKSKENKYSL